MSSCERPIGSAEGKQPDTQAFVPTPTPPFAVVVASSWHLCTLSHLKCNRVCRSPWGTAATRNRNGGPTTASCIVGPPEG